MSPQLKFNWLDLVSLLIIIRVIYIAVSKGFVVEFFKIIATLAGIFFSFQFYTDLGNFFLNHLPFLGKDVAFLLGFVLIFSVIWLLIRYLRTILTFLFKVEPHTIIERWFSLFLGILRASLLISLMLFGIYLLNTEYLNRSSETSLSFHLLRKFAPKTYLFIGNSLSKVFPKIETNSQNLDNFL